MSTSTSGINVVQLETASDIAARRDDVLSQYQSFKDALALRRRQLQAVLEFQNFRRDANELEKWIAEKMAIATDENWKDLTNLEARLQKHAALEAEVYANVGALEKLDEAGKQMIEEDHFALEAVKDRLVELHKLWDELLAALDQRGVRLRQMRALVAYIRQCDEVMSWIKDKEAVIASSEEGRDVEHVQMLQRKFDEFSAELVAQGDRVREVNETADRMVDEEQHPEAETIREKQEEVVKAWEHLNDLSKERSADLGTAAEVQKFKRDTEEAIAWMNEKEKILSSNDVGHDVPSVQALQRRHEVVERDLAALEEKVSELRSEADRLEKEHENDDLSVEKERDAIDESWDRVTDAAKKRQKDLQESYDLQKFLAECRDLCQWSEDMEDRILSDDLVPDVPGAEALLDKHQEHKGEIGAHDDSFNQTIAFGEKLIKDGHPASLPVARERTESASSSSSSSSGEEDGEKSKRKLALIPARIDEVTTRRQDVLRVWEERQSLYDQCLHLALYNRDAEHAEAWLTAQESLLKEQDLGDSLDSVQALLRKHDDLIKSAAAQEEKIIAVDERATKLIDAGHYSSEGIGARRDAILSRHDVLKQLMASRQAALSDSLKLQSFQRDVRNIRSWIADKSKIATDEAHKDPTNLEGKLERHKVFEAEILANEERVLKCCEEGKKLVSDGHYASEEIEKDADVTEKEWKELLDQCRDRGKLLEAACAEQAFNRTVADLHRWMDDMDVQLASEDLGKDVDSVESLMKRHQLLDADIAVHKELKASLENLTVNQAKLQAELNSSKLTSANATRTPQPDVSPKTANSSLTSGPQISPNGGPSLHDRVLELGYEIERIGTQLDQVFRWCESNLMAIDDLEQYGRRNCLIIHGTTDLPESNDYQKFEDLILKTINGKIPLTKPVTKADIDITHKLKSREGRTPIIVKFTRRSVKNEIYAKKRAFKGRPISITESVTTRRLYLYTDAQKVLAFKKVWTYNGDIYTSLAGKKHIVRCMADIDRIVARNGRNY